MIAHLALAFALYFAITFGVLALLWVAVEALRAARRHDRTYVPRHRPAARHGRGRAS